jgi:hypothetical protein
MEKFYRNPALRIAYFEQVSIGSPLTVDISTWIGGIGIYRQRSLVGQEVVPIETPVQFDCKVGKTLEHMLQGCKQPFRIDLYSKIHGKTERMGIKPSYCRGVYNGGVVQRHQLFAVCRIPHAHILLEFFSLGNV